MNKQATRPATTTRALHLTGIPEAFTQTTNTAAVSHRVARMLSAYGRGPLETLSLPVYDVFVVGPVFLELRLPSVVSLSLVAFPNDVGDSRALEDLYTPVS